MLCLVCCYIISTRFCRPGHCDLLTSTPAKAATKRNTTQPNQSNTPAHSNHLVASAVCPLPEGHLPLPPCTSPPPPLRRASPVSRVFHAPSRISPYLGLLLSTALPHPGVACPVGLVLLVRSCLPCPQLPGLEVDLTNLRIFLVLPVPFTPQPTSKPKPKPKSKSKSKPPNQTRIRIHIHVHTHITSHPQTQTQTQVRIRLRLRALRPGFSIRFPPLALSLICRSTSSLLRHHSSTNSNQNPSPNAPLHISSFRLGLSQLLRRPRRPTDTHSTRSTLLLSGACLPPRHILCSPLPLPTWTRPSTSKLGLAITPTTGGVCPQADLHNLHQSCSSPAQGNDDDEDESGKRPLYCTDTCPLPRPASELLSPQSPLPVPATRSAFACSASLDQGSRIA